MYENICSLPLRSDIFAQAIHPRESVFTIGLASGRVQTFRLPPVPDTEDAAASSSRTSSINKSSGIGKSAIVISRGRSLSETGFDVVDTAWQTRRHKGSCRALAFSTDGAYIFSAGTDGIVKGAMTETGKVTSKVMVPTVGSSSYPDAPSILHALSPQALLLGTDTGRLHLYDLRESSSNISSTRPSKTLRPHATEADPSNSEPLTSLTALLPSVSSTSGTSRAWITTSGGTLAMSDLRKGVVTVSEDQGDVLVSSASVAGLSLSKRRRRMQKDIEAPGSGEKIIVGGSNGVVTLWERGEWVDQSGRVIVHRGASGAGMDDDGTVDALAVVPDDVGVRPRGFGGKVVAAGLGNGAVTFARLRGGGGEVVGQVRHDETGVEGVTTLGFEVGGRMISGGGQIVKLWHQKVANEDTEDAESVDSDDEDESGAAPATVGGVDDEDDDDEKEQAEESDGDSDEPQQRKKRKKSRGKGKVAHHGIAAFAGMD